MELKDLVKYYVPMRMEGSSPPNWEVVFGYDISKFKGYNVDEGSAGEWKRAKKSGYLMLLMPPQFPEEVSNAFVACRRADSEDTEAEATARCKKYKEEYSLKVKIPSPAKENGESLNSADGDEDGVDNE